MAHGLSLTMRAIQPHPRPAGLPDGYGFRHPERRQARALGTTARRLKRQAKKARRS